jgi:hypothetical protein
MGWIRVLAFNERGVRHGVAWDKTRRFLDDGGDRAGGKSLCPELRGVRTESVERSVRRRAGRASEKRQSRRSRPPRPRRSRRRGPVGDSGSGIGQSRLVVADPYATDQIVLRR